MSKMSRKVGRLSDLSKADDVVFAVSREVIRGDNNLYSTALNGEIVDMLDCVLHGVDVISKESGAPVLNILSVLTDMAIEAHANGGLHGKWVDETSDEETESPMEDAKGEQIND